MLIVLTSVLLAWAYTSAGEFGRFLTQTPRNR
jgi:NCS1 family nucleobase:cation symporter-1